MKSTILHGDVFDVLPTLATATGRKADCVISSPPYWGLRSYLPADHPLKDRELGQENTPQEYITNMVRVFGLVREVMADHATCWINVGDSYSHDSRGGKTGGRHVEWHGQSSMSPSRTRKLEGPPPGNLCLIPQRLMIALQDDGWFVRSLVVWHKPAPMPSSVTGWRWMRCRVKIEKGKRGGESRRNAVGETFRSPHSDHDGRAFAKPSYTPCPGCSKCEPNGGYVLRRGRWRPTSAWEPIIMLAKSPHYFGDDVAAALPAQSSTIGRNQYTRVIDDPDEQYAVAHDHEFEGSTANPRDVWTIPAEPLREQHYAAFPTDLVRRCLIGSVSQHGYCYECGMPWVRVVESQTSFASGSGRSGGPIAGKNGDHLQGGGDTGDIRRGSVTSNATLGWRPSCSCVSSHPPRPPLVLDLFAGSGRTGIAAVQMGCEFIGVDLNPTYVEMAARRVRDEAGLFA